MIVLKISFLLIFLMFGVFSLFSNDKLPNNLSLNERREIYEDRKAVIIQKDYLGRKNDEITKRIYGDKVLYEIFRGNKERLKLSALAFEMNNLILAKNLVWGEIYYGMMGGLIASAVSSSVLNVLGLIFTLYNENIYTGEEIDFSQSTGLIFGISCFGISSMTIAGIFVFSFLMYKGHFYNFDIIQAKSVVEQYNKYLRKKYGIDPDVSFDSRSFDIFLRIRI